MVVHNAIFEYMIQSFQKPCSHIKHEDPPNPNPNPKPNPNPNPNPNIMSEFELGLGQKINFFQFSSCLHDFARCFMSLQGF